MDRAAQAGLTAGPGDSASRASLRVRGADFFSDQPARAAESRDSAASGVTPKRF